MHAVSDLRETLSDLIEQVPMERIVVAEEHPEFPGELCFQVADNPQAFYRRYEQWMSRFLILNDISALRSFTALLADDGWSLVFGPSAAPVLDAVARWEQPLDVEGFQCPGGGHLHPYQTFGLNRALERAEARRPADRLMFANWAAGAGKSLFACAGAQEMVNRDLVDLVIATTLSPLKINLARFFANTTKLDAAVIEGTPTKRRVGYQQGHQVLVMNYDRFRVDAEPLAELTAGTRVLWIFDEAQQILTDESKTKARKAIDALIAGTDPTVWALSASVVKASPHRFRDTFNLAGGRDNPLGTKADFEARYVARKRTFLVPTKYGRSIQLTNLEWDHQALHEVRHRVGDRTQSVRKTDPALAGVFKGMSSLITPIQLSDEDRRLYAMVREQARHALENEEGGLAQYAQLLRHICNNPEALHRTDIPLGGQLAAQYPKLATSAHCAKLEVLVAQLEGIRDEGDKAVVFTSWVNTSLLLISKELTKRKINHVIHHGGQDRPVAQAAQDEFKRNPDVTVFLSSDAGAFGLNLPEARYVISYEPTFSWDILMQRSERINRADSWLDGLTSYVYICEDSIEERIAAVCDERRQLASVTLGTVETLNTTHNENNPAWLIFG